MRGRLFTNADTKNSPGAVIISETTARRLWPGRDPIGQRMVHFSYNVDVPEGEIGTKPLWASSTTCVTGA